MWRYWRSRRRKAEAARRPFVFYWRMHLPAGMPVAILDADPRPLPCSGCDDASGRRQAALITVEAAVGEIALSEKLDGAGEYGVVIVDLPGVLNQVVGVGASRADLVIVPMRMSFHDVTEAVKLLKWLEAVVGYTGPVNARIVANDVDAIAQRTAAFREAARFAVQHDLPFFNTVLRSRNVFKAMAHQSGSLSTVPADPDQLEKAKRNIGDLMSEILRMFPGQEGGAARSTPRDRGRMHERRRHEPAVGGILQIETQGRYRSRGIGRRQPEGRRGHGDCRAVDRRAAMTEPPSTTARPAASERNGGRSAKESGAKAMKVLRVKLPADLYKKIRVKAALDEMSIGELAEKAWRAFLST